MKKMLLIMLILCMLPVIPVKAEDKPPIAVAIIDSGIAENNLILDYSKILPAKSYIKGITSCKDRVGHGTEVAGIIQKYAPNTLLVPLMFYTKYASGVPNNGGIKAICKAIYDAVDSYQCKIINISSGIYSDNDDLKAAVDYAESKDVIVISAVGNDNKVSSDRIFYPAAYSTVIGVGAINDNFEIADFSQRNRSVMTVMFGVDLQVLSIKNGSDYTTVSGTSYSAAIVSGIAAKVAQQYPDITPSEFRRLIRLSCRDLGEPNYDVTYGYGVLDEDRVDEMLLTKELKEK